MRRITTYSRRYSQHLIDILMSLFALELLSPSPELYLVSAWITDVEILDNHFGQFRALSPETSGSHVRLSSLVNILADQGTKVFVVVRKDQHNDDFLSRLDTNHSNISYRTSEEVHVKALITPNFCWTGSMNFTYSGINKNPETITLNTDPVHISQTLLDVKKLWDSLK